MNTKGNKLLAATMLKRVGVLVTCLLMLSALAVEEHHALWGHELAAQPESLVDTARLQLLGDLTLVNTAPLAQDVQGFAGPTPLRIYIHSGRIDSIHALPNQETPEFFSHAASGILSQYQGKSVAEARRMRVDAVSGATYSSRALLENLRRGLALVPMEGTSNGATSVAFDWKQLLALLVALMAAVVPWLTKNKQYRLFQQLCDVLLLGLLAGCFLSYSSLVGLLAHGARWQDATLVLLLVMGWVYPLFGQKGYYCAWACPFGAAQDLMGRLNRRHKFSLSSNCLRALDWFRLGLWCVLMLLGWTGIFLRWMDYELFTAFLWQSASWAVIACAVVVLLMSLYVNRPYCRFICPTGTLLKL